MLFIAVENSFPDEEERLKFYQKYYQLLLCHQFPPKEKKLCLVGDPDSGKTSWFYPFEGKFPFLLCTHPREDTKHLLALKKPLLLYYEAIRLKYI